jgi:thiamine pyrophosphokinase
MVDLKFDLINIEHHTIILANGSYPTHKIPLAILKHHDYLCCCDRAGMTAIHNGVMPDAIVGDGDSLPQAFQQQYANIFHHVEEQDDNDLTKATKFMLSQGFKKIVYLGATGLREDHTLANISLMAYYHQSLGIEPIMVTDYGYFTVHEGCQTIDSFPHQQVSIFNINCTKLQSRGLRWDVAPFTQLWQGTLNEAIGDNFDIEGNGTYMIYQTFDTK